MAEFENVLWAVALKTQRRSDLKRPSDGLPDSIDQAKVQMAGSTNSRFLVVETG
jgi:hypothetical protein